MYLLSDSCFMEENKWMAWRRHTLLWYHNHIRCEKAKALLKDFDLSISKVGEEVGFVSSAHFAHPSCAFHFV